MVLFVCFVVEVVYGCFFHTFFTFRSLPYPTEREEGQYGCMSQTNTSRLEDVVAGMRNRDSFIFFSVDNNGTGD